MPTPLLLFFTNKSASTHLSTSHPDPSQNIFPEKIPLIAFLKGIFLELPYF